MALSRKDEARALDTDELALVEKSHHPHVQELSDGEVAELLGRLRERRDRAQRIAQQQRRELRRKSAPRGAAPAADDMGSQHKVAVLAMAVRRLNSERNRRAEKNAKADLAAQG